jgi:hypothetical protein
MVVTLWVCQRHIVQYTTHEALGDVDINGLVLEGKELDELTHAVRAVVEGEDGVVLLDAGRLVPKDEGLDKLVGNASLVRGLKGLDGVLGVLALVVHEGVNSDLDAVPALVAVHGVVAANEGDELTGTNLLGSVKEVLDVLGRRLGGSVTAVAERVDVDVRDTSLLSGTDEGEEVVDVRVHTTVREEAHEVDAAVAVLGALESLDDCRLLLELVVLDRCGSE